MAPGLKARPFLPWHAVPFTARRCLSTSTPPAPPPKAFARLTSRRLILIRGRDAPHFLQGLTTRNIPPALCRSDQDPTKGFYSAFLNASGRVLHDVFIYPGVSYPDSAEDSPSFAIEVDAEEVHTLAKHLKRYKLRAKVTVDVLEDEEAAMWSAWDEEDPMGLVVRLQSQGRDGASCVDERSPNMGVRLLKPDDGRLELDGEEVPSESYTIRRMLKGVAEGQSEILRESALPLESNMDYTGGIDFRKGCYVGQELTIRTHHTGVVRKRILPVQLYDTAQLPGKLVYDPSQQLPVPPCGTNIKKIDNKARSTGKWLGGMGNIGLALCRLENMTNITFTGENCQWGPECEFGMLWGQKEEEERSKVKVKAFVPEWHRNRKINRETHRDSHI